MTKDQLKEALINASGAFEKDSSQTNINIIVSEIRHDKFQAGDFSDAVYGTTVSTFQGGKFSNHRDSDGLFLDTEFSKKFLVL